MMTTINRRYIEHIAVATMAMGLSLAMESTAMARAPASDGHESEQTDAKTTEASSSPTTTPPAEDGAPATDTSDARAQAAQLYREGTRAYDLQQYDVAIEQFEAAWGLAPEPELLFNLGQAYWHWFDVKPQIEYLRKARRYFEDYDKRMQGQEDYSSLEVRAFLTALTTQIEAEELKEAERNRPVIQGPSVQELEAAERRRIRREKRLAMSKRFNVTGVTFIAAGSVATALGIAGLIVRGASGAIIKTTSGDAGGSNTTTAEDDERRRDTYLLGGQMAFGSFIAAGVLLPVGIGFRVGGGIIERQELGKRSTRSDDSDAPKPEPAPAPTSLRRQRAVQAYVSPGSLLRIDF